MGKETKIGMMIEAETKDLAAIYEKLVKTVGYELEKGIEQVETAEMKEVADMIKDFSEAKKNIVKACYYVYIMEAMEKQEEEGDDEEEMDDERRGYRGQPRSQSGRFMSRGDGRRSNRGRSGRGRSRRGYEDGMMEDEDWEEMERMREMEFGQGRMYYSGGGSSGGGSSSGGSSGSSGGSSGGRGGSSSGGSSGGLSGGMSGGSSGGSSGGGGSRGYSEGEGGQMSSRMQRDGREGRSGEMRRGYMESKEQGKDKSEKMQNLEEYAKTLTEDVTEMVQGMSPEEKALLKNKMQTLMTKIQ